MKNPTATIPGSPGCPECGYIAGYDTVAHSNECSHRPGYLRRREWATITVNDELMAYGPMNAANAAAVAQAYRKINPDATITIVLTVEQR